MNQKYVVTKDYEAAKKQGFPQKQIGNVREFMADLETLMKKHQVLEITSRRDVEHDALVVVVFRDEKEATFHSVVFIE